MSINTHCAVREQIVTHQRPGIARSVGREVDATNDRAAPDSQGDSRHDQCIRGCQHLVVAINIRAARAVAVGPAIQSGDAKILNCRGDTTACNHRFPVLLHCKPELEFVTRTDREYRRAGATRKSGVQCSIGVDSSQSKVISAGARRENLAVNSHSNRLSVVEGCS